MGQGTGGRQRREGSFDYTGPDRGAHTGSWLAFLCRWGGKTKTGPNRWEPPPTQQTRVCFDRPAGNKNRLPAEAHVSVVSSHVYIVQGGIGVSAVTRDSHKHLSLWPQQPQARRCKKQNGFGLAASASTTCSLPPVLVQGLPELRTLRVDATGRLLGIASSGGQVVLLTPGGEINRTIQGLGRVDSVDASPSGDSIYLAVSGCLELLDSRLPVVGTIGRCPRPRTALPCEWNAVWLPVLQETEAPAVLVLSASSLGLMGAVVPSQEMANSISSKLGLPSEFRRLPGDPNPGHSPPLPAPPAHHMLVTPLQRPTSVYVDSTARLFIADSGMGHVLVLNATSLQASTAGDHRGRSQPRPHLCRSWPTPCVSCPRSRWPPWWDNRSRSTAPMRPPVPPYTACSTSPPITWWWTTWAVLC